MGKAAAVWSLARPFTLLAPALGMVSGSLVALGTLRGKGMADGDLILGALPAIAAGTAMAALLNVASNSVNQIFDLEIDRVNKPDRALPSGRLSVGEAWIVALLAECGALGLAMALNAATFWIVLFTTFVISAYSVPPLRTKRFWWAANPTIAIPRGSLLFVAGWTAADGDISPADPRFVLMCILASMYGLFVLGAATTKDYADMKGDGAQGCVTLPIRFGVKRSVWIIAPFLVLPWLLLPLGVIVHRAVTPGAILNASLGFALALWGAYVVRLLLRDPEALTTAKEHPSWRHMYLMMVGSQAGVALAFWLPK